MIIYAKIIEENPIKQEDKPSRQGKAIDFVNFRKQIYQAYEEEFKKIPAYRREEIVQATYQVCFFY